MINTLNRNIEAREDRSFYYKYFLTVSSSRVADENFRFVPLNFDIVVASESSYAAAAGSDNAKVTKL